MIHVIAFALATTLQGTWSIWTQASEPRLEVRYNGDNGSNSESTLESVDVGSLGIGDALQSSGQHVQFNLHREAGDYAMEGWVGHDKGGGTYVFTANTAFFDDMRRRSIVVDRPEEELAFADLDITREYVDDLKAAGYTPAEHELIAFRALHIDRDYIESVRAEGVGGLDEHQLVAFKALKVDAAYIKMLAAYGYSHLQAQQYVTLRALHVDENYLKDLAAHGFTHLTVEQLTNYKALGIQ